MFGDESGGVDDDGSGEAGQLSLLGASFLDSIGPAKQSAPKAAPKASAGGSARVATAADRVVSFLPDVTGPDKVFFYRLPADAPETPVGTVVRAKLSGRDVGGWIVDVGADSGELPLLEISRVVGAGPPPEVVDLCRWAADEWSGRWWSMLRAASPTSVVALTGSSGRPNRGSLRPVGAPDRSRRREPQSSGTTQHSPPGSQKPGSETWFQELVDTVFNKAVSTIVVPPLESAFAVVAEICRRGPAIVAIPTLRQGAAAVRFLRSEGIDAAHTDDEWGACRRVTAVGSRLAVFAPLQEPVAIVVVDEHDERFTAEGSPTWNARSVAIERARRAGVPCIFVTPVPSVDAMEAGPVLRPSRRVERAGWPQIDLIDVSDVDPRERRFPPQLVDSLRQPGRALVVGNRLGTARLLCCSNCREIAECETCHAAMRQLESTVLSCPRCFVGQPVVCRRCGSTKFANLRAGVDRLAVELPALVGETVGTLTRSTGDRSGIPSDRVIVGTEAALHRLDECSLVAFVDFDSMLSAAGYRSAESVLAALARAARLVRKAGRDGSPGVPGRIVVVTRMTDHPVLKGIVKSDPVSAISANAAVRRSLQFPPFGALALVAGVAAQEFVARLGTPEGLTVHSDGKGSWLVRSADRTRLVSALNSVERPPGRLRLHVDPYSV